jgi:Fanconi anemia group J protein
MYTDVFFVDVLPHSKWYSLQAFRAVNQALGRCIRHLKDYGALFLIDARYAEKTTSLARWLSKSFKVYSSFGFMNEKLKEFYKQVPEELVEAGKWGVAEVAEVAAVVEPAEEKEQVEEVDEEIQRFSSSSSSSSSSTSQGSERCSSPEIDF